MLKAVRTLKENLAPGTYIYTMALGRNEFEETFRSMFVSANEQVIKCTHNQQANRYSVCYIFRVMPPPRDNEGYSFMDMMRLNKSTVYYIRL